MLRAEASAVWLSPALSRACATSAPAGNRPIFRAELPLRRVFPMTMCILAIHAAVNLRVESIMPTRIMPTGITRCMAKAGKGYTDAENERLRAAALAICDERYDGHRTRMADALGIGQPSLSKFLNGNNGAGPYLAEAIAEMVGVSLKELLTGKPAPSVERLDAEFGASREKGSSCP